MAVGVRQNDKRSKSFDTLRSDAWWWPPLRDGVLLAAVIAYSTWAALRGWQLHFANLLAVSCV